MIVLSSAKIATISNTHAVVARTSIQFIFAIGAHCDDKTMVQPVIRAMVEGASETDKPKLKNALLDIKLGMVMMGDQPEQLLEEFMNSSTSRRGAILVAETFARTANERIPVAVLKMAVPISAKNHRVRQALRRWRCPSLARLCSPATAGECRIG